MSDPLNSKNALVTSNTNLTDTDGKSLRILNLAEILAMAGFSVSLVVSKCNSSKARKFSVIETQSNLRNTLRESMQKRVIGFFGQMVALFSFYAKLIFQDKKFDIVVTTLYGAEINSLFACVFSKIRRVPFVYDYDDPSPEIRMLFYGISKNDPRVRLSTFTRDVLVRNSALILAASNTIRSQILKSSGSLKRISNVHILYNTLRTSEIHNMANKENLRKKLGLSQDSFIVCYHGTVPNWYILTLKNSLLHCVSTLKNDKRILFIIVGGGSMVGGMKWETYYKQIFGRLGLSNRIIFTGNVPRQTALEYLAASDLSFQPFPPNCVTKHIVPTKMFEAMAFGIPIVCANLPNYFQILGDSAIFFDGSDYDLAERIHWCSQHEETLERVSLNLKKEFVLKYSWDRNHLFVETLFKNLAATS